MTNYTFTSLGLRETQFVECARCAYVQKFIHANDGHPPCAGCSLDSNSHQFHFDARVPMLLDQLEEASCSIESGRLESEDELPHFSRTAVVFYFCILREVLISRLVNRLAREAKIPQPVYQKLLKSSQSQRQKTHELIPVFTGEKWSKMVESVSVQAVDDYILHDKICAELVSKRNVFIHEGAIFAIDKECAELAIGQIRQMIKMFVLLHNTYVANTNG